MDNDPGSPTRPISDNPDPSGPERAQVNFDKPDSLVGQSLEGRFLIEKNLTDGGADSGGIGVVYLAQDTKLMGKEVVVKILNEAALKHPDIVRKFQHEKEALIRLDHPGIVRIVDSGTLEDGNPFMVMDFIQGHSLRKAIQMAGRLPIDTAAHIIECITDALSAAHSENILHRDIKPENIMLTPLDEGQYRVRIIDFGIARVGESKLAPATEISRAIGSVLYIAPEQLIGDLDISPAADIFATGIVAYEMLTGELPFKPKAIAQMYQLEREGVKTLPSELRPEIPRKAESILMTALEFDPAKRPQNARAFGRYLAHELRVENSDSTDRFFASVRTEFARNPTLPMKAIDGQEFETVQRIKPAVPPAEPQPSGGMPAWLKWGAAAVFVFAAVAIPTILFAWSIINNSSAADPPAGNLNTANTKPVPAADEREVSYHLTVQKMRDGKPFEAPFRSSGQEIFESGYKFTMVFQSDADGYIYLFNEGKNADGKIQYSLLFPTANVNDRTAAVSAGEPIETAANQFTGGRGTEIMWMIWTETKRDDLDAAVRSAFESRGAVKDAAARTGLEGFIETFRSESRDAIKDTANQRTLVKGSGDVVIHRFELEHR